MAILILQQILYRLIQELAGRPISDRELGVGILGYSPFVGQEHGMGVVATAGLHLCGRCDVNPERLDQAREAFPDVKAYDSAEVFAQDSDMNLVLICTPPNTHARLSLQMMAAGKHVLCEKPLALNQKDAAAMVAMAEKEKVHLSCHQNRRWDVDYLAIKQAVAEGLIGELFYMETFVGGFSHPCGYWHSHDLISGGAAYDWGRALSGLGGEPDSGPGPICYRHASQTRRARRYECRPGAYPGTIFRWAGGGVSPLRHLCHPQAKMVFAGDRRRHYRSVAGRDPLRK